MLKKIIAIGLAVLVASTPVFANTQSATGHQVVTNGSAKISVAPDMATLNIGVSTEDANAVKAANDNAKISENVLAELKKLNIKDDDIQTNYYSTYPIYDYSDNGEAKIKGYTVTNSFSVIVRDIDNVSEVLGVATEAGANSNSGISFDVSNKDAYYEEALVAATKLAISKGQKIGSAIGYSNLKVAKVEEISSNVYAVSESLSNSLSDSKLRVPVQTGLINITANVTVTLE